MKQTSFPVFIIGGAAPAPVLVGRTENTNTQVNMVNGVSTSLLAANANRRGASIKNISAATIFLRFAAAAAAVTNYPLRPNESFDIGPDTMFGMYLGEIRGVQASGAAVEVSVLEIV